MSKELLTYPRSVQDITKKYIQDYFTINVKTGKISKDELKEWIAVVEEAEAQYPDEPVRVFNAYRYKFVDKYFPHLVKASLFFKSLLDE